MGGCLCRQTPWFDYAISEKYIQTGDIVYFCSYSGLGDVLYSWFGHMPIIEMGIAVVLQTGKIGLLECISHDPNCTAAPHRHHLRLVSLKNRYKALAQTRGVWLYTQPLRISDERRRVAVSCLKEFTQQSAPEVPLTLQSHVKCACIPALEPSSSKLSAVETCFSVYKHMQLLDSRCNPKAFCMDDFVRRQIPLTNGGFYEHIGYYINLPRPTPKQAPAPGTTKPPKQAQIALYVPRPAVLDTA